MWQVIGQDKAVDFLRRSLDGGHLSHAYLFVGPEHVGKMTLAQNLAQALNCEGEEKPCGECSPCRRIAQGYYPDVQVVARSEENPKEISIDQIRALEHDANLKPYEGNYRVFIIEGAEFLSEEGANSLLKTLEEPPQSVVIILLMVNPHLTLPTIVSRCHRVELQPLPPSLVERALLERWGAAPEKAKLLARLSGGCIGWAISALSDRGLLEGRAQRLEGLISLGASGVEERFAYAAQLAAQFAKSRDSVRGELELWRGWWRDLLLVKGDCAHLITNIDREAMLRHQARHYALGQIRSFIQAIGRALRQLEQNANPRLVLENLMLDIPEEGKAVYA